MIDLIPTEKTLSELITTGDTAKLVSFFESLSPSETARVISRLTAEEQSNLFLLLSPEDAAYVIDEIPEAQAAHLVEDMPSEQAAADYGRAAQQSSRRCPGRNGYGCKSGNSGKDAQARSQRGQKDA